MQHKAEEAGESGVFLDETVDVETLKGGERVEYDRHSTLLSINKVPEDWQPKPYKEGTPAFLEVDNPGGWDEYCFRPKYSGKRGSGDYVQHQLPTEVTPVAADPTTGCRMVDGWQFQYDCSYQREGEFPVAFRPGADTVDTRKSHLDAYNVTG